MPPVFGQVRGWIPASNPDVGSSRKQVDVIQMAMLLSIVHCGQDGHVQGLGVDRPVFIASSDTLLRRSKSMTASSILQYISLMQCNGGGQSSSSMSNDNHTHNRHHALLKSLMTHTFK